MKPVDIIQMPLGLFQVFTYLISCPVTKQAVVIDPAGEEDHIMDLVKKKGLALKYILNTHGHADHVLANRSLQKLASETSIVPICMHEADDRIFSDPTLRQKIERELGLPGPDPADIRLKDGDILQVGTLQVQVIHTPGHTPGSVCFFIEGNLFTGDTLFVGAVGRTDLTGGSLDTLLDSLEKRLVVLPGETIIWPGHNYGDTPTSTIAREMDENPYITDFLR